MDLTMVYTTWGYYRRGCGHVHDTVEDAMECVRLDQARTGGRSDRRVLPITNARYEPAPNLPNFEDALRLYDDGYGLKAPPA